MTKRSLSELVAARLAWNEDAQETESAYWRLNHPTYSSGQAWFEGSRLENARLAPYHAALAKCVEALETIARPLHDYINASEVEIEQTKAGERVLAELRKIVEGE